MKFKRLDIPDIILCQPEIFGDNRGYFTESFRQDKLNEFLGYPVNFCQENQSKSSYGVLRGLHYQLAPHAQTKLVSVTEGEVLDITVDIRQGSSTFGKHVSVRLSSDNKNQLFVPRGFAHGFVVLSDEAVFSYKVDNYYNPDFDRGIVFDDSELGIDWCIESSQILLSEKDKNLPIFRNAEYFTNSSKLYE